MERVLEIDLRLLAHLLGPRSVAAEALGEASGLFAPQFYRDGQRLLVVEAAVDDTVVLPRIW